MSTIEKAIRQMAAYSVSSTAAGTTAVQACDPRVLLIVTVAYLLAVLSVPLGDPGRLLWMLCYPIIMAEAIGVGYARIFMRSLWVLPLVALIGVFNPILDTAVEWRIGSVAVSHGWITFASLTLRGLLAFQGLLILITACGFYDICRALQYFKCPRVLVTQLLMLYRYMGVLLTEALGMKRAREARGFGRKSYPLKMWGVFAGQLLMRAIDRSRRVHNAMLARGFTGVYCFAPYKSAIGVRDWAFAAAWVAVLAVTRFVDLTTLVSRLF